MSFFGRISRTINRLAGGNDGQTLCARMAWLYGSDCLFCRVVGFALRDQDHCADELRRDMR